MKWFRTLWIGTGGLVGLIVAYSQVVNKINERVDESIRPYVESNLSRIINEQEEKIGIRHFGVPEISHKFPPGCWGGTGCYTPEEDTIHLLYGELITPEKNLTNNSAHILINGVDMEKTLDRDVEKTLNHELGHFYADKLNESLGKGDWPKIPQGKLTKDKIGTLLVAEGVAEYFERVMSGEEDNFNNSDWPKKIEGSWKDRVIYDGGFHLVKPIIDNHGKDGIEYLIGNPPTVEELKDLPKYQKEVLEFLSK